MERAWDTFYESGQGEMAEGLAGQLIRARTDTTGAVLWSIFTPDGIRLGDQFRERGQAERALQALVCAGAVQEAVQDALAPTISISEVLKRYQQDEVVRHRGAYQDGERIRRFRELALAQRPYVSLCLQDMYRYIRERRGQGAADPTILREMEIWKQLVKYARRHGLKPFEDPFTGLPRLRNSPPKYRELTADEERRIRQALKKLRNPEIGQIYRFLEASGIRFGATMEMRWEHVDLRKGTCVIPIAKSGVKNQVLALTPDAIRILATKKRDCLTGPVWKSSRDAFRMATRRLFKRLGLVGFRRHDLRHKCITRLVRSGLFTESEVMKVSGHTDRRSLARYTHIRSEDVSRKMRRLIAK